MDDPCNTNGYGYHGSCANDMYNATTFPERCYAVTGVDGYNRVLAGEIAKVGAQAVRPYGNSLHDWIDERDRKQEAARIGDGPPRARTSQIQSDVMPQRDNAVRDFSSNSTRPSLSQANLAREVGRVETLKVHRPHRQDETAIATLHTRQPVMATRSLPSIESNGIRELKASIRKEVNAEIGRHLSSAAADLAPVHGRDRVDGHARPDGIFTWTAAVFYP